MVCYSNKKLINRAVEIKRYSKKKEGKKNGKKTHLATNDSSAWLKEKSVGIEEWVTTAGEEQEAAWKWLQTNF